MKTLIIVVALACMAFVPLACAQAVNAPPSVVAGVPSAQVEALGCNDPLVQCVDVCSGRVIPHFNKEGKPTELTAAEDEIVVVRAIGKASCAPSKITCTSFNVSVNNVGFVPSATPSTSPPGGSPGAQVELILREPSVSRPADSSLDTLTGQLLKQQQLAKAPLPSGSAAGASSSAAAAASAASADASRAAVGLEAVARAKAAGKADLGVTKVLYAMAAMLSSGAGATETAACATTFANTRARARALEARLDHTITAAGANVAPSSVDALEKARQAAFADVKNLADAITALAPEPVADAAVAAPADCNPNPPTTASQVDNLAALAEQAASSLSALRTMGREVEALTSGWAVLSDCEAVIPHDTGVREAIVDVQMAHQLPPVDSDGGDEPAPSGSAPTTHAPVRIGVNHGKYYYDVATVAGVIVDGQHTVSPVQRPGQPGATEIGLESGNRTLFGLALTVYPAGHRRQSYAIWDGHPRCWDGLGLQAGFDATSLSAPFPTIFTGLSLEPVTGIALSLGAAFLPRDRLINGYALGQVPPPNQSDYVNGSNVGVRFYAGLAIGYELFHTTGARLATAAANPP